jgi:hypothetical protein
MMQHANWKGYCIAAWIGQALLAIAGITAWALQLMRQRMIPIYSD